MNISDRIRYLRDKNSMTQTYLAKKLGISRSAVNSWEMSISTPSLLNIVEMARLFNVSIDYLLCITDRVTVDITELSAEEQELIIRLIGCIKAKNAK